LKGNSGGSMDTRSGKTALVVVEGKWVSADLLVVELGTNSGQRCGSMVRCPGTMWRKVRSGVWAKVGMTWVA
jgi:hypothetical protein